MTKRILFFISIAAFFVAATILAQGPQAPQTREAPVTSVPFDRLLKANQEPQNWLTYGGALTSQRHSGLTQVTTTAINVTLPARSMRLSVAGHCPECSACRAGNRQ